MKKIQKLQVFGLEINMKINYIDSLKLFILSIISICFLDACKNENQDLNKKDIKEYQANKAFTINTFTNVPKKIAGCSCLFSKDSIDYNNGKYIYVNDFAETSFVTINDTLVKFNQTAYRKADTTAVVAKYISKDYKMMILVKNGEKTGKESISKTGLIKITNAKGKSVKQTFYGKCGC